MACFGNASVDSSDLESNMAARRKFDARKVARYERLGWEAYYSKRWSKALGLLVRLNREQFGMPFWRALAGALDIVRASLAFAPLDNDVPKARRHLERFYEKARYTVGIETDADHELIASDFDDPFANREFESSGSGGDSETRERGLRPTTTLPQRRSRSSLVSQNGDASSDGLVDAEIEVEDESQNGGAEVVSLDAFRKK